MSFLEAMLVTLAMLFGPWMVGAVLLLSTCLLWVVAMGIITDERHPFLPWEARGIFVGAFIVPFIMISFFVFMGNNPEISWGTWMPV